MKKLLYLLIIWLSVAGCSHKSITIGSQLDTRIASHATAELVKYLSHIYPETRFEVVDDARDADIQLILENGQEIASAQLKAGEKPEPVRFSGKGGRTVLAIDPKGTMNLSSLEIKPLNQYQ